MPEDYYGDGGDAAGGGGAPAPEEGHEEPHDTGVTAVVPSELCPGMKVGDEMVVKIIGVDDDSYEISYAPEKGKPKAEEEASAPPPSEGSMASMME